MDIRMGREYGINCRACVRSSTYNFDDFSVFVRMGSNSLVLFKSQRRNTLPIA